MTSEFADAVLAYIKAHAGYVEGQVPPPDMLAAERNFHSQMELAKGAIPLDARLKNGARVLDMSDVRQWLKERGEVSS